MNVQYWTYWSEVCSKELVSLIIRITLPSKTWNNQFTSITKQYTVQPYIVPLSKDTLMVRLNGENHTATHTQIEAQTQMHTQVL